MPAREAGRGSGTEGPDPRKAFAPAGEGHLAPSVGEDGKWRRMGASAREEAPGGPALATLEIVLRTG